MADQIEQLRVPVIKSRRKKTMTPADKKDAAYLTRRAKNNRAAALNRARRRAARDGAKERSTSLIARNVELRVEVETLEAQLNTLMARRSTGTGFMGLSPGIYSLSPPVCEL